MKKTRFIESSCLKIKTPKGEKKKFNQTPWEDQPKAEKISQKWAKNPKESYCKRSPIRRWLHSRIGKTWNEVFSEFCKEVKDQEFREMLTDRFVELNVIMVDDIPCYADGVFHGHKLGHFGDQFYVCPKNGTLKFIQHEVSNYEKKIDYAVVDDTHQCHKIDGIWYIVELEPFVPQYQTKKLFIGKKTFNQTYFVRVKDLILGMINDPWQATKKYGGYFKSISKKQMNKKEIKKLIKDQ